MKTSSDQELLDQYSRHGSETAFAELVRRHVDTVFSAAVRLIADRHLAEDVVQQVFLALARHARSLSHRTVISGWLHRTTHNFAVMIIRKEERRQAREQKAATMAETVSYPSAEPQWSRIVPHLDQAIAQLSESDQDAIALRFFERKTAADIGQRLGISEDAAQKRVHRALDRLRRGLAQRSVAVSLASLSTLLTTNAIEAAPASMTELLTARTLSQLAFGAAAPAGLWNNLLSFLTTFKASPVAAVVVGLLVASLATGGT